MQIFTPITVTSLSGDSEVVRIGEDASLRSILEDVKAAIVVMYDRSNARDGFVFEEFLEKEEITITGVPLTVQVTVFAELKDQIDAEQIYIESADEKYPCMKLRDYLTVGPTNHIINMEKGDEENDH